MAKNSTNTILIIFDIDETLVQYINCNNYFNWTRIGIADDDLGDDESYDKLKAGNGRKPTGDDAIDSSNIPYLDSREKNGTKTCVLFRPNLDKFFNYVRNNNNKKEKADGPRKIFIDIALWTAGSIGYAKMIGSYLEARYGLDTNYFVFIYSEPGSDEDDELGRYGVNPRNAFPKKDLTRLWNRPEYNGLYNKFNTIIVDDDVDNLKHESNKNNGILVNKFMPFGGSIVRIPLTKENYTKSNDDTMFADLTKIVTHLVKDRGGCNEDDVKHGCAKNESIFHAFSRDWAVEGNVVVTHFKITPNSYAILLPKPTPQPSSPSLEAQGAPAQGAAAEGAAAEGAAAEGGGYRYSLKKKKGRRGTRSRGTRKINKKRKGSKRNKK